MASIDPVRQWQLFWVYVRDRGTCSFCGKPVSPDDAATDGARSTVHHLSDLAHLKLVHLRCRSSRRLPWEMVA